MERHFWSYFGVIALGLALSACAEDRKDKVANPASANCVEQGGTLEIESRGDGGQYGICHLADGRACEEWALMRGQCPKDGADIAGITDVQARYCVLQGGQLVLDKAECRLPDGKQCSLGALYGGTC
ncbi:MAG: DUF333 domain-containing protein [Pseudomonadota bacterium]